MGRYVTGLLLLILAAGLTSCVSVTVGAKAEPSRVQWEGFGTAYAAANGIRPYDATFFKAQLLSGSGQDGELASMEIWPLGGIGVGLLGARLHLLPVEIGAGILGYHPKPITYAKPSESGTEKEKSECKPECEPTQPADEKKP